jgi:hypothetical protein
MNDLIKYGLLAVGGWLLYSKFVSAAPVTPATGGTTGGGTPAGGNVPASGPFDFLTNPVSIFGFSVPTWGVFAALGFGAFALAGKHR